MTTGSKFVNFLNKKLVTFEDLGERFFKYLQSLNKDVTKYQFREGSFYEKVVVSAQSGALHNGIARLLIKPTEQDYMVHDGQGHLLDVSYLGQNVVWWENSPGVLYHVGAAYCAAPFGITINSRTGKPEYVGYIDAVGDEAEPNSVSYPGSGNAITFRVDSLVANSGEGIHNRTVRIFKKIPADGATTESTAIQLRTVTFSGGQNTITTSSLLGQITPSLVASDYIVQLVGISVRRSTNPEPIATSEEHFFAGTILGAAAGSITIDDSGQNVIHSDAAGQIQVASRSAWADGVTNPATNAQAAFDKIITDLAGANGSSKIFTKALSGSLGYYTHAANRLDIMLQALINDIEDVNQILTFTSGLASFAAGTVQLSLQSLATNINTAFAGLARQNTFTHGQIINTQNEELPVLSSEQFTVTLKLLMQFKVNTGVYFRLYGKQQHTFDLSYGVMVTINAKYTGGAWSSDDPAQYATRFFVGSLWNATLSQFYPSFQMWYKVNTGSTWVTWDSGGGTSNPNRHGSLLLAGEYMYAGAKTRWKYAPIGNFMAIPGAWGFASTVSQPQIVSLGTNNIALIPLNGVMPKKGLAQITKVEVICKPVNTSGQLAVRMGYIGQNPTTPAASTYSVSGTALAAANTNVQVLTINNPGIFTDDFEVEYVVDINSNISAPGDIVYGVKVTWQELGKYD